MFYNSDDYIVYQSMTNEEDGKIPGNRFGEENKNVNNGAGAYCSNKRSNQLQ